MKALVYNGPGSFAVETRPMPELQEPGDAIVKISKTTLSPVRSPASEKHQTPFRA